MKLIAIIGAIQGIILCLYILPRKRNRRANLLFLSGMLLTIAQMILVFLVGNPFRADGIILLKVITWIIPFAVPALVYFYFRFLLGYQKEFANKDWIHAVPIILSAVLLLPYVLLALEPGAIWLAVNPVYFAEQGLMYLFLCSYLICYYGMQITKLYQKYKNDIQAQYSNLREMQLSWIQGNGVFVFAIGLFGLVGSISQLIKTSQPFFSLEDLQSPHYFIFIPISLLIYWCSYRVIETPELFKFLTTRSIDKKKYENSTLSESTINSIAGQLISLMVEDKIHSNPNLTLSEVASRLNSSNQIVSQVLNQHFEISFFEFVNGYRLEAAKSKLKDPLLQHLSVQGIALESGFRSKSTFYDLFKKDTGQTPVQYQKG